MQLEVQSGLEEFKEFKEFKELSLICSSRVSTNRDVFEAM